MAFIIILQIMSYSWLHFINHSNIWIKITPAICVYFLPVYDFKKVYKRLETRIKEYMDSQEKGKLRKSATTRNKWNQCGRKPQL